MYYVDVCMNQNSPRPLAWNVNKQNGLAYTQLADSYTQQTGNYTMYSLVG